MASKTEDEYRSGYGMEGREQWNVYSGKMW